MYDGIQSNRLLKTLLNLLKILALESSGLDENDSQLLPHERIVKNFFWKIHDQYLSKELNNYDHVILDDGNILSLKKDKVKEVVNFLLRQTKCSALSYSWKARNDVRNKGVFI